MTTQRMKWLQQELERAYRRARQGKTRSLQVVGFDKVAATELSVLAKEIHDRIYQPRPSTAFIIHKPVKREIFAADFRDRIVHHFLFNQVNEWWDARFIEDNYSCRKGKGTLYGIRRLDHHIRSVSDNYARPAYVLQLDLEGDFMSLCRQRLYKRALWGLERQFPERGYVYQVCRFLWKVVVFNDPTKDARLNCPRSAWKGLPPSKSLFHQPKGRGVAIGNLTSQLISNIYLDIDGVLLVNEENLSIGAVDFIKYAVEHFDVYWLTTHCMDGDPAHAIEYLNRASTEDLRPWLEKFKPVTWSLKKTEAIDFGKPFLWFDDDCFTGEKIDLLEHNVLNSWIEIDLRTTPDQMAKELVTLQAYAEEA